MELAIAILGSSVLATLISGIFQVVNNRKSKVGKLENGMSLLLLSAIIEDGKKLQKQGKISKTDHDIFMAKYEAYKSLGGDGWADSVMSEVTKLHVDYTI